ncbi:MAG: LamG domain-containing protein [Phycisphaerae bacterium]|nr:LamG domain-containing protein [Phycisphaerae bacterium]
MRSPSRNFGSSPQHLLIVLACLLAGANGAAADLNDGLVGYWSFDEGDGETAYDYSGHGNHGTIDGAAWTTGISGSALNFDGDDDYVEVDSFTLSAPDPQTQCMWFTLNDLTISRHLTSYDARGTFTVLSNATLQVELQGNPNGIRIRSSDTVATGQWHFVCLRLYGFDVATGRTIDDADFYIDGVVQDKSSYDIGVNTDIRNTLYIGCYQPAWGSHFDGIIDEVRIYDRVLSHAEILDLYWSTTHPDPQEDTTDGDKIDVSGTSADPVNTATGSFFHQETDLSIPSRGLPLTFTRFYNSKAAAPGRKAGKSGKAVATGRVTATSQPASPKDGKPSSVDAKKHNDSPASKDQKQTAGSSQARPKIKEKGK